MKKKIFFWVAVILLIYVWLEISNQIIFYHDSLDYWKFGDTFFRENTFSFTNAPESFRGYFFPLMLRLFRGNVSCELANIHLFRILWAFVWGTSITLILNILTRFANVKWNLIQGISVFLLVFLFWKGEMKFPLSDIFSIFLFLLSLQFLIWTKDSKNIVKILIGCFFAGLFLYFAYNVRSVYWISIPFIVAWYFDKNNNKLCIISLIIAIFGFCLGGIPQSIINNNYYGSYSISVTNSYPVDSNEKVDLSKLQMYLGLTADRYESLAPETNNTNVGAIKFVDNVGMEIVLRESLTVEQFTIKKYISLFVKYPAEMISIYTRHFFAIMDNRWDSSYVNLNQPSTFLFYGNLCIFFIFFYSAFCGLHKFKFFDSQKKGWNKIGIEDIVKILIIIVPPLAMVVSQVEIRYLLLFHLFVYAFVASIIDYDKLIIQFKKTWFLTIVYFIIWSAVFITITSDILSSSILINPILT